MSQTTIVLQECGLIALQCVHTIIYMRRFFFFLREANESGKNPLTLLNAIIRVLSFLSLSVYTEFTNICLLSLRKIPCKRIRQNIDDDIEVVVSLMVTEELRHYVTTC